MDLDLPEPDLDMGVDEAEINTSEFDIEFP